eukprot:COSAG01_NODE_744_length_13876_cov_4.660449_15_plen_111_part_00
METPGQDPVDEYCCGCATGRTTCGVAGVASMHLTFPHVKVRGDSVPWYYAKNEASANFTARSGNVSSAVQLTYAYHQCPTVPLTIENISRVGGLRSRSRALPLRRCSAAY